MVNVDLYCRVSTQEQAESGYSLAEQEERLRKYCESQGWIVNRVLSDGGYSGAKMDRPALQSLINDCEKKTIDKVVVYKLDRLSRRQKDTLYLIEDVFLKNGIDFVSITESFDTSSPFGVAMLGILSVFAQLERENIKQRMRMGMDARIKTGKYRGGGHIPIGFRYEKGILSTDEYEAETVLSMFRDYANGETANSIAVRLMSQGFRGAGREWSANKVLKVLKNPLYNGRQRYNGEEYIVEGCPIIVDDETFEKVQRIIALKSKNEKKPQSPHRHTTLLGGLVWCGECGSRMVAESDIVGGKRIHRFYCYNRILNNHKRGGCKCNNRSFRSSELNDIVIGELSKFKLVSDIPREDKADAEAETKVIRKRIEELDKQTEKLVELFSIGAIEPEAIKSKAESIKAEKDSLVLRMEGIEKDNGKLSKKQAQKALSSFREMIKSAADDDEYMSLYSLIHELIVSITVTNEECSIVWNV